MLRYRLYQDNRRNAPNPGFWYARPTVSQTYDLNDLAEHMAQHDTPFSKGVIYGVLTDMVNCIRELVLDGNAVKIPNLAIFSAGLTTKAAEVPEEFNAANIKSVHLRARSTGVLTRAELTTAARVQQLSPYNPKRNAVETEGGENGTGGETGTDEKTVNP